MNNIHFFSVFSFDDRLNHLKIFDSDLDIWVVSDLILKKRIKYLLSNKQDCFHSGSIMRAQEFWIFLFNKLYPDFNIKNDSLIKAILKNFLLKNNLEGESDINYIQNLFSCISSFLPLFVSQDSPDYFRQWIKKNPDPYLENWFNLSFKAWQHLLKEKTLSASFLPGVLSSDSHDLFSFLNKKKITFDLGFQLKALEASCIKSLSKVAEIKILKPDFYKDSSADSCLWTYKLLDETSLHKTYSSQLKKNFSKALTDNKKENKKICFTKYSNQLAEIRGAIEKIKIFLKQGAELSDIAIVAADIEYFWPVLSMQLEKENLGVSKALSSSLHSNKLLIMWLARLRVALGGTLYSDLEAIYTLKNKASIFYEDLKQGFSNIYSTDIYKKEEWSKNLLEKSISKNSEINLDDFLKWAFSFWNFKPDELYFSENSKKDSFQKIDLPTEQVWKKVYQILRTESDISLKLSLESWLLYTEELLAKENYSLLKETANAISCYNIINSDNLKQKHIIILDLSFDSLKNKNLSPLSFAQSLSLSEDLGVSLDASWASNLEILLKYIFQSKDRQIACSWSETNLEAKKQVVSAFFLEEYFYYNTNILKTSNLKTSALSRGDLEQINYKNYLDNLDKAPADFKLSKILYDKNLLKMSAVPSSLSSVSVTNISRYGDCPFIFFAEKILKLKDLPNWNLDIDPLNKGNVFHKLLELIISEGIVESEDFDKLFSKLNDYIKKDTKIDDTTWMSLQDLLVELAKDFIKLEKDQKQNTANLKVQNLEHSLKAFWSIKEQDFISDKQASKSSTKNTLLIKGKADRIDADKKFVVIKDYKSSIANYSSAGQWKNKKDLSLFLYYKLWKANNCDSDLLGAIYVDIKTLKAKGLWSKDKDYKYINLMRGAELSDKDINEIFFELDQELKKLFSNIIKGNFAPNPKNKTLNLKTCKSCKWSGLCRISKQI